MIVNIEEKIKTLDQHLETGRLNIKPLKASDEAAAFPKLQYDDDLYRWISMSKPKSVDSLAEDWSRIESRISLNKIKFMTKSPENLQPDSWHRYFAINTNNAAWSMSETLEDVHSNTELLDMAHASAWHWRVVGTPLNQMRSTMLLALIHARMDMGPSAWRYAECMKKYFTEIAETPDWELAFVYAIHAWAALACGKLDEYTVSYHKASLCLEAIKDHEDRVVVLKTFNLIPKM